MKKTAQIILIFMFSFGLVFPNQAVFGAPSAGIPVLSGPKFIGPTIPVIVVQAKNPSVILDRQQIARGLISAGCQTPAMEQGSNFVQESIAVNLNQPADCFSLAVASKSFQFSRLEVQPLAQTAPVIKVAYSQPYISSPAFAPMPSAENLPILPAAVFSAILGYVLWEKRKATKALDIKSATRVNPLTLQQLQVMRC